MKAQFAHTAAVPAGLSAFLRVLCGQKKGLPGSQTERRNGKVSVAGQGPAAL
ncbi:MAG: hypothetical protein IT479_07665 [Xanthomonadales bacterium]|nr:hypothetical protein [Xanthomonadales bacterium]